MMAPLSVATRTSPMTTIYCLPGTMCTADLWLDLRTNLPADIELRHLAIPQQASVEDIVDTLAAQLPDQAHLLGFSLGGYLAASIACRYPSRVARLSLISNTPCALSDKERTARQATLNWLSHYRYGGLTNAKAATLLDPSSRNDERIQRIIQMDADLGADVLLQQLKATTERFDLADPLVALGIPIHFFVSREDPLINHSWLHALVARSTLMNATFVEGSGHMLPMEQPDRITNYLKEINHADV